MNRVHFRVLYREFLFRVVDLEILTPQGDMLKLLGQFAALLIFISLGLAFVILASVRPGSASVSALLLVWVEEHFLIATTMLVVGLFAVLSWDSAFPDKRDVVVLSALPVRAPTLFLAKVAAVATALGITLAALNMFTGIAAPFVFAYAPTLGGPLLNPLIPANGGLLAVLRSFAAYWIAILAAGVFMFGCVLSLQGLAQLLPRQKFLRVSSFLQIAFFVVLLTIYFLQPPFQDLDFLFRNRAAIPWVPSYWFFGLFQQLSGPVPPPLADLARRAEIGLAAACCGAAASYLICYFRTLRMIAEQPDILRSSRGLHWSPRFGRSLETAVGQFSLRTLMRSRQHRVILSFYLGIALGLAIFISKAPVLHMQGSAGEVWYHVNAELLVGSMLMTCATVVGTRVVFSMPLDLRANWVFRILPLPGVTGCLAAIRRSLYMLAVAPTLAIFAALLFWLWPWRVAAEHLLLIGLLSIFVAELSLHSFPKIPFTCSYLPGKSYFHIAALAFLGLIWLTIQAAGLERSAFDSPSLFAKIAGICLLAAILARLRTSAQAKSEESAVQFEDLEVPEIQVLGLNRDGGPPVQIPHAR
jgi:hypothetical protein